MAARWNSFAVARERAGKVAKWVWKPLPFLALCFGICIGAVTKLPLIPYVLPDPAINLLGAAMGAALAVVGAAWVSNARERRSNANAFLAVATTVEGALLSAEDVLHSIRAQIENARAEEKSSASLHSDILGKLRVVNSAGVRLKNRIDFMTPLFIQLGGGGVVAQGWLETVGPKLIHLAEHLPGAYGEGFVTVSVARMPAYLGEFDTVISRARRALQLLKAASEGNELPDKVD